MHRNVCIVPITYATQQATREFCVTTWPAAFGGWFTGRRRRRREVTELTVMLTWLFTKTGRDVAFQLPESGWFQGFKVDLDFVRIRIAQGRFSRLNYMYNATQFVT